jgi:hypothetical protein
MTDNPSPSIWQVEKSHPVAVPASIEAVSLLNLQRAIQLIANGGDYGEITYRWELDPVEPIALRVHCYFIDRQGKQRRFMRLAREL